ncbi:hypothetical protein IV102_11595 [bacterium]|nr:hypothetical protein [bacterium]
MLYLLPSALALVAHLSTLAAMVGLSRAYDCDLYLPGGTAFDPRRQNRLLGWATGCEWFAALWLVVFVIQREGVAAHWLAGHAEAAAALNFFSSAARLGVPVLYLLGMHWLTRVGRHLSKFSDLRMTRPDGSVLLPRDLMRPLWLAVNAHGAMLLIVPPVLLYRSLGQL